MIDRILVSRSDTGGEQADSAIEMAAELARAYDAELVLVSHASPPDLRQVLDPEATPSEDDEVDAEAAGISRRFPAVKSRVRRVAAGDPAKAVMSLAFAEKADLIVVANLVEPAPEPGAALASDEGQEGGTAVGVSSPEPNDVASTKPAPGAARGRLRTFYSDRLGWAALFTTSFILAYGGGAVMFWLHAIYRGEHGPAISDWSHWLLDSSLGFVALTPILFFILPTALWLLARGDGSRRIKLWSYVAVVGTMFTLVTGPGPLLHNTIAGHGTWLADLATVIFGHDAETAERNMHAMEHSQMTEGLLQMAVGLPVYLGLAWLALRLMKALTAGRSDREDEGSTALKRLDSQNETEADREDH